MPDETEAREPVPSSSWPYHREPRTFSGRANDDVDSWLKHFKRVSNCNKWDAASQLSRVVFYLTDVALVWYENHEDILTTWERFVGEIKKCFGNSAAKKKLAEQSLAQRAQLSGETCTVYTEEILRLCREVDSSMSEEDKVGHLLKGIAEDVYNFLISRESLTSVSDVVRHCRTFETLKQRRIAPKFGRLANVTSVASIEAASTGDLSATIRQIVREELLRHGEMTRERAAATSPSYFPQDTTAPQLTVYEHPSVNATEVAGPRRIQQSSPVFYERSQYPQRFRSVRPYHPPTTDFIESRAYANARRREHFEERRRPRPAPVCYNCGLTGHISRYCDRSRIPRYDQWTSLTDKPAVPPFQGHWPTDSRPGSSFWHGHWRNNSPASDRSVTPPPAPRSHRSPSPRRRPSSPHQEN